MCKFVFYLVTLYFFILIIPPNVNKSSALTAVENLDDQDTSYNNSKGGDLNTTSYNSRTSKYNTIVLYPYGTNEYAIKKESISLDGYLDIQQGQQNQIVQLYEINYHKNNCLLSEYKIEDPISTHFTFYLNLDDLLLNCDENYNQDHELELMAKLNSNFSNTIALKVYSAKDELPIPRWEFEPEKYLIPSKVNVSFSIGNISISHLVAHLDNYHLYDKYPDNIERYYPLESPYSGKQILSIFRSSNDDKPMIELFFIPGDGKSKEPSFLNVFLRMDDSTHKFLKQLPNLYELNQADQSPWKYVIPSVPDGLYDLVIRAFFNNVMGEYVTYKIDIQDQNASRDI